MNLPLSENKDSIFDDGSESNRHLFNLSSCLWTRLFAKRVQIYNSFLNLQHFAENKLKKIWKNFYASPEN